MSTIIQIKRATVTATPVGLANGELAFSGNLTSNSLFVGSPDGSGVSIRIAGGAFGYLWNGVVGTLTANATPITDANSFVSNVKSAGLYLGPTALSPSGIAVTTINAVANSTVLGAAANTELTTTWAVKSYVDLKVAGVSGSPGGANTQIQYNDSGVFAGSAAWTFDKTTNVVTLANTLNVGANVTLTTVGTGALSIGNSTVNTQVNSTVISTGTVNHSLAANVGANVNITTSTITVGNSVANLVSNSISVKLSNATSVAALTPLTFSVGNSTVNVTTNSTVLTVPTKIGVNTVAPSVSFTIVANDGIQIPVGNTSTRPTGNTGVLRYNPDANTTEIYANANWFPITQGWKGDEIGSVTVIEDTATNLILQSEDLTQAAWTAANATISASGVADIFGGALAQLITPSAAANSSMRQLVSVANDNLGFTASIYVNQNCTSTASKLQLTFSNSTANTLTFSAAFNAQTGLVTSLSGSPTNWQAKTLNNGWTRITLTANNNNTTANAVTLEIFPDTGNASKTLIYYAGQLEKSSGQSSYIKTTTVAKTRPAGHLNLQAVPYDSNNFADNGVGSLSIAKVDGGTY